MVFVDFDGTLVDSSGCWKEAYSLFCNELKLEKSLKIISLFDSLLFNEWIDLIGEYHCVKNAMDKMNDCAIDVYKIRIPKQDVINKILFYKNYGHDITIVTWESEQLVESYLKYWNIITNYKIISKSIYREDSNFYRDVDVLIDDSLRHCQAAKKAGIYVIGVNDNHSIERQQKMEECCNEYIR